MDFLYQLVLEPIILFMDLIYDFTFEITGLSGFSIIILCIIVNVLLLPVKIYAKYIMKKELDIQVIMRPKVIELKNKYKGEQLHNELSNYYKTKKYHPVYFLRTSFGLFIQIPFFIGAYIYFRSNVDLSGVSFGIIKDLLAPDSILSIGAFTINIIPLMMTVISLISVYLNSNLYFDKQIIQQYVISVIFLVLLYNEPSGLLLYWTTNNVIYLTGFLITKKLQLFS
jgi:YidC/Oxa1 family membrane protein insertase